MVFLVIGNAFAYKIIWFAKRLRAYNYYIGGMRITLYEQMLFERQKLEKEIKSIQSQIHELPDGKLVGTRNGSRMKWYQSDGHSKTYIPKENQKLIEQLAVKKYLTLQAEDLLHEQNAIDFYLTHHAADAGRAERLLSDRSEYAELLSKYFKPLSQELLDWTKTPYEHNEKHPEQLIHKTIAGNSVRSKSEVIITMLLYVKKIPFRYECALKLGTVTIYPDFTIRHPQTGKVYYWEHFGMMDDPGYAEKAFSKLRLYALHGIVPSIQLLATFETKEKPLSFDTVEDMIERNFLR